LLCRNTVLVKNHDKLEILYFDRLLCFFNKFGCFVSNLIQFSFLCVKLVLRIGGTQKKPASGLWCGKLCQTVQHGYLLNWLEYRWLAVRVGCIFLIKYSLIIGTQSVLCRSQGICDQFPGDPWMHFFNGYFKVWCFVKINELL